MRSDDVDVTFDDLVFASLSPPSNGESILPSMIETSAFVGVGRIARLEPRLTRQRDDIESLVTLDVAETIKGAEHKPIVTFTFPDGTVTIGKTRVRIVRDGDTVSVGDTVLVFARQADGVLETNRLNVFRIAGGQIKPLAEGIPISGKTDALDVLADVKDVAASLAKRPLGGGLR